MEFSGRTAGRLFSTCVVTLGWVAFVACQSSSDSRIDEVGTTTAVDAAADTGPNPEDAGRQTPVLDAAVNGADASVGDGSREGDAGYSDRIDASSWAMTDAEAPPIIEDTDSGRERGDAGRADAGPLPLAEPPIEFQLLEEYRQSADFAFAEDGTYVGMDEELNLVRIPPGRRGQRWLNWPIPRDGEIHTVEGIALLPDGSALVTHSSTSGSGSLLRVYPDGTFGEVPGEFEGLGGVTIGPDGFVYLAERTRGRVRRIDPDSGDFSIVALGLYDPLRIAFGDDPALMYVSSLDGSGIYRVEIPAPGELGTATVFARPNGSDLPKPAPACPDQVVDAPCPADGFAVRKCQTFANVVECLRYDPCPSLNDGDDCWHPERAQCHEGRCFDLCAEREGAACTTPRGGSGHCQADGFCQEDSPHPCEELEPGTSCEGFGDGVCGIDEAGRASCVLLPCAENVEGGMCGTAGIYYESKGVCRYETNGELDCEFEQCKGLEVGDPCEFYYRRGVCRFIERYQGWGAVECVLYENRCATLEDGERCRTAGHALRGVCDGDSCRFAGGINGLAVDAAGFVYASEVEYGNVYRISPEGDVELLVTLPTAELGNLEWGPEQGGFSSNVLYAADSASSGLFALEVGGPGR